MIQYKCDVCGKVSVKQTYSIESTYRLKDGSSKCIYVNFNLDGDEHTHLCSDCMVGILWKMCDNGPEEENDDSKNDTIEQFCGC